MEVTDTKHTPEWAKRQSKGNWSSLNGIKLKKKKKSVGCTKAILESHLCNKILIFENFRYLDYLSSYTETV